MNCQICVCNNVCLTIKKRYEKYKNVVDQCPLDGLVASMLMDSVYQIEKDLGEE